MATNCSHVFDGTVKFSTAIFDLVTYSLVWLTSFSIDHVTSVCRGKNILRNDEINWFKLIIKREKNYLIPWPSKIKTKWNFEFSFCLFQDTEIQIVSIRTINNSNGFYSKIWISMIFQKLRTIGHQTNHQHTSLSQKTMSLSSLDRVFANNLK